MNHKIAITTDFVADDGTVLLLYGLGNRADQTNPSGALTGPISSFNAGDDTAAIRSALEVYFGSGNVTVTGSLATNDLTLEFTGPWANAPIAVAMQSRLTKVFDGGLSEDWTPGQDGNSDGHATGTLNGSGSNPINGGTATVHFANGDSVVLSGLGDFSASGDAYTGGVASIDNNFTMDDPSNPGNNIAFDGTLTVDSFVDGASYAKLVLQFNDFGSSDPYAGSWTVGDWTSSSLNDTPAPTGFSADTSLRNIYFNHGELTLNASARGSSTTQPSVDLGATLMAPTITTNVLQTGSPQGATPLAAGAALAIAGGL